MSVWTRLTFLIASFLPLPGLPALHESSLLTNSLALDNSPGSATHFQLLPHLVSRFLSQRLITRCSSFLTCAAGPISSRDISHVFPGGFIWLHELWSVNKRISFWGFSQNSYCIQPRYRATGPHSQEGRTAKNKQIQTTQSKPIKTERGNTASGLKWKTFPEIDLLQETEEYCKIHLFYTLQIGRAHV